MQLNDTRSKYSLAAAIVYNREDLRALTRRVRYAPPFDYAARWVRVGEEAQTSFEGALSGKFEGDTPDHFRHGHEQPRPGETSHDRKESIGPDASSSDASE
jgi:hypothetical protein